MRGVLPILRAEDDKELYVVNDGPIEFVSAQAQRRLLLSRLRGRRAQRVLDLGSRTNSMS
jgi:hypothetical protein